MSESVRTAESPTPMWETIFRYDFGIAAVFASLLSWLLILIWIETDEMGGLGVRQSSGVTSEYFNWHPFLMSTAFLMFMAPAVVAFEMYPMARATNKNVHGMLMGGALCAAMAGLAIILDCHNVLSDSGSFKTLHGSVGLFTLIILVLNYFGGLVMYVLKMGGTLRGSLKPLHKRLGFFCMMMGFATICIGVQEKADKSSLGGVSLELTYAIGIFVYTALGSVIFSVAKFADKSDASHVEYSPIKTNNPNDPANASGADYGSNTSPMGTSVQS